MRKYFAEFIGTFVLVLFACGAAAVLGCSTVDANAAYALTALAFGLVIVGMAYSIGNISGCHINPAVSLAMLISGKMNVKDFVGYVVAQVAGAFAGSAVMLGITGGEFGYGANGLYKDDIVVSLIVEVILTCVFVLVILGVTSKAEYSNVAGLVIGFTLTLVHIFGIHFTGTSVNPARSLAPAVFTGGAALSNVWVFIVGPLVGGAIAALIWKVLAKETK
ncbi:MAG: aquaporin [Lachnospiraceae bacterium]|nr:aquaporin [Lachnospiraceae bacterium]